MKVAVAAPSRQKDRRKVSSEKLYRFPHLRRMSVPQEVVTQHGSSYRGGAMQKLGSVSTTKIVFNEFSPLDKHAVTYQIYLPNVRAVSYNLTFKESAFLVRERLTGHLLRDLLTNVHNENEDSRPFLPRFILPEFIGLTLAGIATLIGAIIFPNAFVVFVPVLIALVVGYVTIALLLRRWGEVGKSHTREAEAP